MYIVFLLLILCTKFYFIITNKFCKSQKRLDGKTCVVTGGTSGMGLEIAKEFARRGAKVIVACPFEEEGCEAEKIIKKETGNNNVIFKNLDLASIESTRKFAREILETEKKLDILMNNAGVAKGPVTKDGLNMIMQVNYYGHFLLTILLLPLLKKTGTSGEKSRILNTSSIYHYVGYFKPKMFLEKESETESTSWWKKYINRFFNYANSKLYLMMFSVELTDRLKGHNVVINTIDPGAVGTAIFQKNLGIIGLFLTITLRLLVKTPWEGAQTALQVALDEELGNVSGKYFRDCQLRSANSVAYKRIHTRKLWDESVRLVKLNDFEGITSE